MITIRLVISNPPGVKSRVLLIEIDEQGATVRPAESCRLDADRSCASPVPGFDTNMLVYEVELLP